MSWSLDSVDQLRTVSINLDKIAKGQKETSPLLLQIPCLGSSVLKCSGVILRSNISTLAVQSMHNRGAKAEGIRRCATGYQKSITGPEDVNYRLYGTAMGIYNIKVRSGKESLILSPGNSVQSTEYYVWYGVMYGVAYVSLQITPNIVRNAVDVDLYHTVDGQPKPIGHSRARPRFRIFDWVPPFFPFFSFFFSLG